MHNTWQQISSRHVFVLEEPGSEIFDWQELRTRTIVSIHWGQSFLFFVICRFRFSGFAFVPDTEWNCVSANRVSRLQLRMNLTGLTSVFRRGCPFPDKAHLWRTHNPIPSESFVQLWIRSKTKKERKRIRWNMFDRGKLGKWRKAEHKSHKRWKRRKWE